MKIGIARLWHEANSFSATRVGRDDFMAREWLYGNDEIESYRHSSTELGGVLAWAASRDDVDVIVSRCASAPPGGPVHQALLDEIIDEIVNDPELDGVDALYLSLHGACSGTEDLSPETTLVCGLRQRFPDLPIAASFDMHCCPTESLVAALNVATVYRTYPHVDMDRAAWRALELLTINLNSTIPTQVVMSTTERVLPSFNMRTDGGGPMEAIESLAVELEQGEEENFIGVYPFASFAYADLPSTNSGALVTTTSSQSGRRIGRSLADEMFARRAEFLPALPDIDSILSQRPWESHRRLAVLDPGDNPLSGGMADTPGLLEAALRYDLPEGSVLAFYHDPELVKLLQERGIGARLAITLGGRHGPRFGPPVKSHVEIIGLTDGHFVNAGPMERGVDVNLGPTAVVRAGSLRIVITSICQSPNDPEYFALHDIDIEHVPLLLAKAKNHFRAALGHCFDEVVQVDLPGPAMADISGLPFQHIPHERFKLDD